MTRQKTSQRKGFGGNDTREIVHNTRMSDVPLPPDTSPQARAATHSPELLAQVAALPALPGVYRYFDARGGVLYVGKARNLRKRVSSYFQKDHGGTRIGAMVIIYPKDGAWDLLQSAISSVTDDFRRPEQGTPERDLADLDPTPAATRSRVYRTKKSTSRSLKSTAAKTPPKRQRKSA